MAIISFIYCVSEYMRIVDVVALVVKCDREAAQQAHSPGGRLDAEVKHNQPADETIIRRQASQVSRRDQRPNSDQVTRRFWHAIGAAAVGGRSVDQIGCWHGQKTPRV